MDWRGGEGFKNPRRWELETDSSRQRQMAKCSNGGKTLRVYKNQKKKREEKRPRSVLKKNSNSPFQIFLLYCKTLCAIYR